MQFRRVRRPVPAYSASRRDNTGQRTVPSTRPSASDTSGPRSSTTASSACRRTAGGPTRKHAEPSTTDPVPPAQKPFTTRRSAQSSSRSVAQQEVDNRAAPRRSHPTATRAVQVPCRTPRTDDNRTVDSMVEASLWRQGARRSIPRDTRLNRRGSPMQDEHRHTLLQLKASRKLKTHTGRRRRRARRPVRLEHRRLRSSHLAHPKS